MSGISYEFDRRSFDPKRGRDPQRILRVLLIFCIVAAVTVGAIFLIVPKKEKTAAPGNAERSATTDGNTALAGSGENGGSAFAASPEAQKETGDRSASGQKGSGSTETAAAAGSSGKAQKGVLLPNDPAPGEDTPEYPPTRTANAEAALEKIRNASTPAEKIAAAEEFMLMEAANGGEFSRNFLTAGQLLAQANAQAPVFTAYKVVKGDFLEKIARKNGTTVEKIRKDNQLKNDMIGIGRTLKVLPGPWKVTISRSARVLCVWRARKGKFVPYAAYSVGVGRKNSTPLGDFTIGERLYHPKWKDQDKREYPYGDPKNPLGECFLVFQKKNVGIHGTAEDASVGRSLSSGCIRMHNADVETLFLLLPAKTPVKIVE